MIEYVLTREDGMCVPGTLMVKDRSYVFTFDEVEVFGDEEAMYISIITKEKP